MPNWQVVDDANSAVSYSSGWSILTGSSRQWESAVHSTGQAGASATFRFRGTGIQVYGTIPSGPGKARSQYSIDGGVPVTVERQSGSSAVYVDLFFQRDNLRDRDHTIVVTNIGTDADFQLDKFEYMPSDSTQVLPPPQPTSTQGPVTTTTTTPRTTTTPTTQMTRVVTTTRSGTTLVVTTTSISTSTTGTITGTSMSGSTTSSRTSTTSTTGNSFTDARSEAALGSQATVTKVVSADDGSLHTITDTAFSGDNTGISPVGSTSALSKGAIAGIIIGAVLTLLIALCALVLLCKRKRSRRSQVTDEMFERSPECRHDVFAREPSPNNDISPFDLAMQRASARFSTVLHGFHKDGRRSFARLGDNAPSESSVSGAATAVSPTDYPAPVGRATGGMLQEDMAASSESAYSSTLGYPSHNNSPNDQPPVVVHASAQTGLTDSQSGHSGQSFHRRRNFSADITTSSGSEWNLGGHEAPPSYNVSVLAPHSTYVVASTPIVPMEKQ